LALMRAETPEQFGLAVRWRHAPAWVIIVSLVGFVRLYLRAGRRWLAWAIVGVRTLSLILNFGFSVTTAAPVLQFASLRQKRTKKRFSSVLRRHADPKEITGKKRAGCCEVQTSARASSHELKAWSNPRPARLSFWDRTKVLWYSIDQDGTLIIAPRATDYL
jgi:hypothetical protein